MSILPSLLKFGTILCFIIGISTWKIDKGSFFLELFMPALHGPQYDDQREAFVVHILNDLITLNSFISELSVFDEISQTFRPISISKCSSNQTYAGLELHALRFWNNNRACLFMDISEFPLEKWANAQPSSLRYFDPEPSNEHQSSYIRAPPLGHILGSILFFYSIYLFICVFINYLFYLFIVLSQSTLHIYC